MIKQYQDDPGYAKGGRSLAKLNEITLTRQTLTRRQFRNKYKNNHSNTGQWINICEVIVICDMSDARNAMLCVKFG